MVPVTNMRYALIIARRKLYEALKARSLKLLIVVICETSFDIMHIKFSYETDPSTAVIRNEVEKMHGRLC